jgi:hypothetical protein
MNPGRCSLHPLALAMLASLSPAGTALENPLEFEDFVRLEVACIIAGEGPPATIARRSLDLPLEGVADLDIRLAWPDPDRPSRLRLEATGAPGPPGGPHSVRMYVRLDLPDGRRTQFGREARLQEGTSTLWEISSRRSDRLLLSVQAERSSRPVVRAAPLVGTAVRFDLALERVAAGSAVPLETYRLHSLVGQGVEYAFRRGGDEDAESVRIVLTPVRLTEDIAEVRVEITGSLPGPDGPLHLHRTESLLVSRGSTSVVTATLGDPPTGYRFLITPDF